LREPTAEVGDGADASKAVVGDLDNRVRLRFTSVSVDQERVDDQGPHPVLSSFSERLAED
jgi:hypothetical protein